MDREPNTTGSEHLNTNQSSEIRCAQGDLPGSQTSQRSQTLETNGVRIGQERSQRTENIPTIGDIRKQNDCKNRTGVDLRKPETGIHEREMETSNHAYCQRTGRAILKKNRSLSMGNKSSHMAPNVIRYREIPKKLNGVSQSKEMPQPKSDDNGISNKNDGEKMAEETKEKLSHIQTECETSQRLDGVCRNGQTSRKKEAVVISNSPWLDPIKRRDKHFVNTGKPRFPCSNSLSSGIFREIATSKEWLGKSSTSNAKLAEALAIKERIAADIYAYFGVKVPKIELSLQKMTNVVEVPGVEGKESMHVMSELFENFRTYKEAFGENFKLSSPNPNQEIVLADGTRIPERGLGNILAVATLINDIDVLGSGGGNIGFQIISHPIEGAYAQSIKIDPGEAFAMNDASGNRKIRVAFTGTPKETELNFEDLPNGTKKEFLLTLFKIMETNEATFRGFFIREGAHHFVTYNQLTIEELTKLLLERKAEMIQAYREYLDDTRKLLEEQMGSSMKKKSTAEQARSAESQAYQEELFYYIDPHVIDENDPLKQIKEFTIVVDQYLDFSGNEVPNVSVMLVKGESGAGKSLTLRSLEQRLLLKRREQKDSPMPILIDLKKFNKYNVDKSFERVLREKYCNEYDPQRSQLVVLMDGYDEISGGCQQNLYNIQKLERYSKNIKVIITCRTQYLTSGYTQWFKPTSGELKELEIQQFNDEQIRQYLMKYVNGAERQGDSYTKVLKKINATPNLKELIANPFMLRLVAESLPRIDEYIEAKQNMLMSKEQLKETSEPVIFNKYAIYERFMEHWFAKQEMRLSQSSGHSNEWEAVKSFREFSGKVALILHSKREVEIKVKGDQLWEGYFSDNNPEVAKARNGCPLRRQNDHQYSFIHKSFLEYFAAKSILDIIIDENLALSGVVKLTPAMITQDPGVIAFFKDAFILDPLLEEKCFKKIEESRENSAPTLIAATATNAITLLNAINYDFSNKDLNRIKIPNANLSHGSFEGTNFESADLTNVNFASSCLENANLRKANLTGVSFGELPYSQFEDAINCLSFDETGARVAAGMGTSIIIFERDLKTGSIRELKRIQNTTAHVFETCTLASNGKKVITCCKEGTPQLWDVSTGALILELGTAKDDNKSYDISPDGNQIAYPSKDNSLLVWNTSMNVFTHEFTGHKDKVTCCKFSPDGTQILSGSCDKTIRIWDVANGISTHKAKKEMISQEGLKLSGVNISDVIGLSDSNLMLLYQRGAYGFNESEEKRFIENLNVSMGRDSTKLDFNQKSINDESARAIGISHSWIYLEILDLSQNLIGNRGAIGLGQNMSWTKLKSLNLAMNVIGDEGALGLAKNRAWTKLEVLDLQKNVIGDTGARALTANTALSGLQHIYLRENKLNSVAIFMRALNAEFADKIKDILQANSQQCKEVEGYFETAVKTLHHDFMSVLDRCKDERKDEFVDILKKRAKLKLDVNDLSREGFFAETDLSLKELLIIWIPEIQFLDLSNLEITKEAAFALIHNTSLTNLQELVLSNIDIGDEGASSLAKNLSLISLRRLLLENCLITNKSGAEIGGNVRWSKLEELNLSGNKIGDTLAEAIGKNKALSHLKNLSLADTNISPQGAIALVKHSDWKQLEVLNLSYNSIGDEGASVIGDNKLWGNLKELYLTRNGIGNTGAVKLATNTTWKGIRVLDLADNEIEFSSISQIMTHETWKNLEKLNLSNNKIDEDGGFEIGKNKTWANLKELYLDYNEIKDKGVIAIESNKTWINLEVLSLKGNDVKRADTISNPDQEHGCFLSVRLFSGTSYEYYSLSTHYVSIYDSETLVMMKVGNEKLRKLDLSNNNIGVEVISAISLNLAWKSLEVVDLSHNLIGDEGAFAISQNSCWQKLKVLNLAANNIGDHGAASLGNNKVWIALEEFYLSQNNISHDGAIAMGKNRCWTNLKVLSLHSNKISDIETTVIGDNIVWSKLEELDLSTNQVGKRGASSIGRSVTWTSLKKLNLSNNRIDDEGGIEIASNCCWSGLIELRLSDNELSDASVEEIVKNKTWVHLKLLDLGYNKITDEGGVLIANNTSWIALEELILSKNAIGDNTASAISANPTWKSLKKLALSANKITDEGGETLFKEKRWDFLEVFECNANALGDKTTIAIANNTSLSRLRELDLSSNHIHDEGAHAFSGDQITWIHLKKLALRGNKISPEIAFYIRVSPIWKNKLETDLIEGRLTQILEYALKSSPVNIELDNCGLGDFSALIISRNGGNWTNLTRLDLRGNGISDLGGTTIGSNTTWVNLKELILAENQLGDESAIVIGNNNAWVNLKKLDLECNSITDVGGVIIGTKTSWTELEELNLAQNIIGNKTAVAIGNNSA